MIEVEQLCKVYGSTTAIKDVSFKVKKGEILGLLGPNGAGKTTTMRILSGYLPATRGSAKIDGHEVHENPMAVRQCIGYLPENPPLYPEMSVEGYLHFVGRIKDVARGDRNSYVDAAIHQCGLIEHRKTLIRKLSKGYRQRVGIAQAIVHKPKAIILDEPTVGLDPRQIIEVRNLIKSLAEDGERTIILSSHILPEVRMTCNRIAIINKGKIVTNKTFNQLVQQVEEAPEYELEIRGDRNLATTVLKNIPSVIEVAPLLNRSLPKEHHRFKLTLGTDTDAAALITQQIVQADLELYEFRKLQATLEEVFLNLTMESDNLDDEEATANRSET